MLTELPTAERDAVRSLFDAFPGLRGGIDAALDGPMGRTTPGPDPPQELVDALPIELRAAWRSRTSD